jgi:hypothetical protein
MKTFIVSRLTKIIHTPTQIFLIGRKSLGAPSHRPSRISFIKGSPLKSNSTSHLSEREASASLEALLINSRILIRSLFPLVGMMALTSV